MDGIKSLNKLKTLSSESSWDFFADYYGDVEIIKKYIKAIEIIKKHKMVWFDYLFRVDSAKEYNKTILQYYDYDKETAQLYYLTQKEFDSLKEVLL